MTEAFIRDAREACDTISIMVSYIIVHGIGEQPPPSPDGPTVMRVPPEEFWRILRKISDDAASIRDKAEGLLAEQTQSSTERGEAST